MSKRKSSYESVYKQIFTLVNLSIEINILILKIAILVGAFEC
jgi:hypothetical protein